MINITNYLKDADYHRGFADGIEAVVRSVTEQLNAQQAEKGESPEDEDSTVQEL